MLSSELQTFLPVEVSDLISNGGAMSASQVISGVVQNVWPHVTKAERLAGSRKYRMLYDKVSNDDDETLINPGYYLDGDSLGEDWVFFYPVAIGSTQSDWVSVSPPTRKYVSGTLKAATTATDTVLTVVFKDAEQAVHILDADSIRVSDKTDPDQVAGNEALLTISGTPVVSGAEATVTFSSQVGFVFAADVTKISVIYEPSVDTECTIESWVETFAGDGTAEESLAVLDNIGTVHDDWTFQITGTGDAGTAISFTVSGVKTGALASGLSNAEYAPSNPDFAKPFFTFPALLWSGTLTIGDTLTFTTKPAAVALVQERRVPAGCASLANNRIRKVTTGESAS